MIQLFILYLAITECIQVFIANKKIIKWILPILNFIISLFVEINLIVFTMLNDGKNFFKTIDKEVVLLFLILNIPTIIYIITNIVIKKRKENKKV